MLKPPSPSSLLVFAWSLLIGAPRIDERDCKGLDMLRRKPTRLELKAEDKEEFDEARKQAAAAAASASAATNRPSSGSVVSTLLLSDRPKLSTAQRIGLSK
ncbi:hypothetical protein O6H91_10G037200 [Diphasiastrum complanatum]|uniref:Uncharacterized protein n=1 Tax=Diphasiastrum complanatum TaxID=34168 RepID=A0ACC2CG95_DIPCM|nr:hypothetical protein O6H91_10G037200 [Diphasiastrum complanatum]